MANGNSALGTQALLEAVLNYDELRASQRH